MLYKRLIFNLLSVSTIISSICIVLTVGPNLDLLCTRCAPNAFKMKHLSVACFVSFYLNLGPSASPTGLYAPIASRISASIPCPCALRALFLWVPPAGRALAAPAPRQGIGLSSSFHSALRVREGG